MLLTKRLSSCLQEVIEVAFMEFSNIDAEFVVADYRQV